MTQDKIPQFRTANASAGMVGFSKMTLGGCTNHKVGRYQLFDIDPKVSTPIMADLMAENGDSPPDITEDMVRVIEDWGKYSVFRLTHRDKDTYEVGVVIGHRDSMFRGATCYREWAIHASGSRRIDAGANIDLLDFSTKDIDAAIWCGKIAVLKIVKAILDRPATFSLSKGPRTRMDVARNTPATVTISLSKPVVRTAPSGHHSGAKMPEHLVRGHERRYASGKVVWVKGHKRGDPDVQRKTTYRVTP